MSANTFPLDRIQRRARCRSFFVGVIAGAVLMFAGLAVADLSARAQAAHVIVRGEA